MFTKATKNYGSWRSDHRSHKRNGTSASYVLALSMGILAFVAWLMFFIAFKSRGDFYFFETSTLQLSQALTSGPATSFHGHRPAAAALAILRDHMGRTSLLFDDGKLFLYPQEIPEIEQHLNAKARRLELTAMLTKAPSDAIGRIQIWSDRSTSLITLRQVMTTLTRIGFDEFDFAMLKTAAPKKGTRKTAMTEGQATP